jgi:putative sterol carrier protein
LTLKTFFRPEIAKGVSETYELHIDNEVLQVRIIAGELQVRQGAAINADLVLYTDISSYLRLLTGQINPDEAIAAGLVRIEGTPAVLNRFLNITRVPSASE